MCISQVSFGARSFIHHQLIKLDRPESPGLENIHIGHITLFSGNTQTSWKYLQMVKFHIPIYIAGCQGTAKKTYFWLEKTSLKNPRPKVQETYASQ